MPTFRPGCLQDESMKSFSSALVLAVLAPIAASGGSAMAAEVDLEIHNLCIEAKDYVGCVKAMKGGARETTVRQIQSQGADIAEGNQCQSGFAYVGGGNCMEVKCIYNDGNATALDFEMGHDSRVAGKADWGCKRSFWFGAGVMRLEGNSRASINPECPPGEPVIGFNSTCQNPPKGWESPSERAARELKEASMCDAKLKDYQCSYSKYLEANPNVKIWAELNPEMAEKQRVKLRSVD